MAVDTLHEIKAIGRGANTETPYTLAVSESLKLKEINSNAPLEIFEKKSGFSLSIVGGGTPFTGFIRLDELPTIETRTKIVSEKMMDYNPKEVAKNGKCFSYHFNAGNFKGKSPAELYLSEEATLQEIKNQGNFLAKNLGKYPKNQEGIDAIKDLIEKIDAGELGDESVSSISKTVYEIHKSGTRYFPKKENEEFHNAWEITITCNIAEKGKSPYEIKIEKSKVTVDENNMISSKKDIDARSITLTEYEFDHTINRMRRTADKVEDLYYINYFRYVQENKYSGK